MNKIILGVFLVLCIVAISVSHPVEEEKQAGLSLKADSSSLPVEDEEHDTVQERGKRQFWGGYGGYGGYGRRWGGYGGYGGGFRRFRGYGGYGGYGFYG